MLHFLFIKSYLGCKGIGPFSKLSNKISRLKLLISYILFSFLTKTSICRLSYLLLAKCVAVGNFSVQAKGAG